MTPVIEKGAPSSIKCFIPDSPHITLRQATKEQAIISRHKPVPLSRVSVGYLVPFSQVPCNVQCVISNEVGWDSFTCKLQGIVFIKKVFLSYECIVDYYRLKDRPTFSTYYKGLKGRIKQ